MTSKIETTISSILDGFKYQTQYQSAQQDYIFFQNRKTKLVSLINN